MTGIITPAYPVSKRTGSDGTLGHLQHRTDLLLLLSLPAGVLSGIAILWAAKILFG
jgi:hypothetical protein